MADKTSAGISGAVQRMDFHPFGQFFYYLLPAPELVPGNQPALVIDVHQRTYVQHVAEKGR